MPRYVILFHETPPGAGRPSHWDLMLESTDGLLTWALEALPQADALVAAEALPVHRAAYLDYEGLVSGNRGSVVRWDAGSFQWEGTDDTAMRIRVCGQQLQGVLHLAKPHGGNSRWQVAYDPDSTGPVSPAR